MALRGKSLSLLAIAAVVVSLFSDGATAQDVQVDLELVLAVDISLSMDEDEQILQRDGYVSAFRTPEVIEAIRTGPIMGELP
jgi:Protein of unknown function (DUF1194)